MPANTTTDTAAFLNTAYDVLIVGGGTAGLALAARYILSLGLVVCACRSERALQPSEDPNTMVGVIEAGPNLCGDPLVSSAGVWVATAHSPQYSWGFSSELQTAAAGRTIPLAR